MTSSIVSGVFDACSAGILLWGALVECLAHDFVFDRKSESPGPLLCPCSVWLIPSCASRATRPVSTVVEASNGEVTFCVFFVFLGAGLMALLGRWA